MYYISICNIYCIYLICILYILYIAYICRVKSKWYINRTSFTTYIVEPTLPMVLRMTSSGYKVRGCPGSIPGWVLKKEKAYILYMYYISICNIYCIYILCILYILYISYICRVKREWYINRNSFTTYIVEPMRPMVLRMTSSGYKVRECPCSIQDWILKKEKSIHHIFVLYMLYVIYIVYILYTYYIFYILHVYVESKVSGI